MSISTHDIRDSGIRKAAIFVASLDQSAADLLLDQLPPECADRVRQAAVAIDRIDADERRRVIDEFRRIGSMIPDPYPPGIELDGPMAPTDASPLGPAEQDPSLSDGLVSVTDSAEATQPFEFLYGAEEEKLVQLLDGERPQTVALVLSHLPPERAGDVLGRLPASVQIEVVRRLVDLEHTDADTLREIEQALEARLTRQFAIEPQRRSGPDTVARILAACSGRVAGGILDNLAQYDEALAEQLGRRTMKFDDLAQLDDAALSSLVEAVNPEVIQAALLGAPPSLVDRILCGLRPEDARRLSRKLECPEPIRLSDVEEARRQVAELAARMTYDQPSPIARAA